MENLRTAISLAFVARKNICLYTDDYNHCVFALKDMLLPSFAAEDMIEIDLLQCHSYDGLVSKMVKLCEGKMPELYKVVLWRNLEVLEINLAVKSHLLRLLNEIERYDTLSSRKVDVSTPIQLGEYLVRIPDFFIIMPIMCSGESFPKLHRQLKDKFWFCQSYYHTYNQEILATEVSYDRVVAARNLLPPMFVNAEVREYVCSLMVFTRSHRLCSLAPLSTRPTLRAAEGVMLLAKTLVAWASVGDTTSPFVTPDYVKIAFRKVGYWLVDWETNKVFLGDAGSSYEKRTEISLLTGDWYRSEWVCVEKYLNNFKAQPDMNSTTGFTNRLIEDVLESVLPPL